MDGRRHSVDIPISKALTALRRVRSLRDPSTNSMSKFTALLENVNWDTNSCNGISLQFVNGSKNGDLLDNLHKKEEKCARDLDFQAHLGNSQLMDRNLELDCITPSSNYLEDADSCSATTAMSSPIEKVKHATSNSKFRHRGSIGLASDLASSVGSPKFSGSDTFLGGSSLNTSLFANEEDADLVDYYHARCKVNCCWSRTPKSKSFFESEGNNNPLLLRAARESYDFDASPYLATPRSLSQKFRPKSFVELVGQNVVSESLLSAISRGRIASMYLFHGPRGTGKTSASRIFAAALNCLTIEEHGPCGHCRECIMFFSGRSQDVREVDSMRLNRKDVIRSLVKSASDPPVSSRFKVFIIDECQLLNSETWGLFLNNLEKKKSSRQMTVFVMITPDLEMLPRSVLSCSQRYSFHKIKDAEISSRLGNICAQESLDFDQAALDFIAAKANGSLRDAEMMLDQLSFLGKRITMSLANEFIGTVSDDELLDLLDLALSCDTSNTVIRARELMRSRIDPMQLISQLANLIMDILSGNCQEQHSSESRRSKFFRRHTSEADLHKLSHALKILSESEKQLRMSKNQSTWLTVALLQLSSVDSSPEDENDSSGNANDKDVDGDNCGRTALIAETQKNFIPSSTDVNRLKTEEEYRKILDSVWRRATNLCNSNSLKNFLRKHGKISSLGLIQGLAVAELDFDYPHNVSRAEKSWKVIARSLQSVVGCNVEIRINVASSSTKCINLKKKLPFSFFNCSLRMDPKTNSVSECGGTDSDCSSYGSEKPMIFPSKCSSHIHHQIGASSTLRNGDGNVLSMGNIQSHRTSSHHDHSKQQTQHYEPYVFCANHDNSVPDDNVFVDRSKMHHCLRTPALSMRKSCEMRHGKPMSSGWWMGWVLPCAAVK